MLFGQSWNRSGKHICCLEGVEIVKESSYLIWKGLKWQGQLICFVKGVGIVKKSRYLVWTGLRS